MSTAAEQFLAVPAPDVPRDRWKRPMIVPPGGGERVAYTRCTTYVGCLEDTYNITQWKLRCAAAGLGAKHELYLRASSLGPEPTVEALAKPWKNKMDDLTKAALEAGGANRKALIGTSLHSFTEAMDRGEPVAHVPPEYATHLRNYAEVTAGLTAHHIEEFVVNDALRVGGTPDRVLAIDGEDGLFIGDVKSGSVAHPHKMAMQLAMYAHSQLYNVETDQRTPVEGLRTDKGLIIALDQVTGECTLHWIDLVAAWEAVALAGQVHTWRKVKALTSPYVPPAAGQAAPAPQAPAAPASPVAAPQAAPQAPPAVAVAPAPPRAQAAPPAAAFPLSTAEVVAALAVADKADPATAAAVKVAIANAEDAGQLYELWRAAGPAWLPEYTALAAQRKAELAAP